MTVEQNHFLTVDEFGQVFESSNADAQVSLPSLPTNNRLKEFYQHLELTDKAALKSRIDGKTYYVEAFDAPIMIEKLSIDPSKPETGVVEMTTGFTETFSFSQILVDDWDRFYTVSSRGLPMIFSDEAQNQLFEFCDEYGDDFLKIGGQTYLTQRLYPDLDAVEKNPYWDQVYQEEAKPGWDLNQPSPVLVDMLPRLKLPKSRILVLGCGFGHDAAFFAQNGHLVTAVDFSPLAIEGAKQRYGHLTNIQWHTHDALNLPSQFHAAFDLVFEHTCYCAINPMMRQQLVKTWTRCLVPNGTLFGVFFSMFKFQGPPFGTTEWEIRKRLIPSFQFLFWNRWRKSVPGRMGRELFVYARKKSQ